MEQMAVNEKCCKNCGNCFPGGIFENLYYCAEYYEQDGGNKEVDPDGFCSLGIWKEDLDNVLAACSARDLNATDEIVENEQGGKQHKVEHRCEALFPLSILEVAKLRAHGHDVIGYEDDNYRNISPREHIGRAMRHLLLWQAGDAEDGCDTDHLVHACCRTMMALELILSTEEEMIQRELKQLQEAFGYDERR